MQPLTEQLIEEGLADRVLTERQLDRVIGGSPAKRYGLVNRAMKSAELIRLQRGMYLLADRFRDAPPHPFALAQALVPGSYVSFETALAHHGWIPEAVRVTASVTPGRKSRSVDHPRFGAFVFSPLAIRRGHFLELIERQQITQQTMLLAEPIRALMDLVCLRKMKWQGMNWLLEGLRIDGEQLHGTTLQQLRTLATVYKQARVSRFLQSLQHELGHD
jgi:predicted transcriptional regulator of viral defense system